jgi:hypothetical protein
VGLVVLVILAAGIEGTSHFGGVRWFPHLHGKVTYQRPGRETRPEGKLVKSVNHHATSLPWWVGAIVVGLLALVVAFGIWSWWSSRRLPAAPLPSRSSAQVSHAVLAPEPEPEPEALLSGIALALKLLDDQREPGDAVVRAWLGLEQTAEESGIARYPSETPTEFTSRILRGAFADDAALRTLLRLYLRSRFGDHPVTADDVSDVREALQQLLASWRPVGGAPASGAGRG